LNTNWKIVKIVNEIGPIHYPPPVIQEQGAIFSENPPNMDISFFNVVSGNLIFSGQDSFYLQEKTCTLADYMDDNGEVNAFFDQLCSFFYADANYYYSIQNDGVQKNLVIGNSIFGEIHFNASAMSTNDTENTSLTFAPNPVKDFLTVQNFKEITSIKIFDISGKLVFEQENKSKKILTVDMRNFKPGTYFIRFNDDKVHKIIKQ